MYVPNDVLGSKFFFNSAAELMQILKESDISEIYTSKFSKVFKGKKLLKRESVFFCRSVSSIFFQETEHPIFEFSENNLQVFDQNNGQDCIG